MRLMSAAPRGVAANSRSSATTRGRRRRITSSACSVSASEKATKSPGSCVRSLSAGSSLSPPIRTVHESEGTLENLGVLERPPPDLDLADDVFLRHWPPVAAVGAVVAVIAHHEVIPLLDDLRTPVIMASEFLGHI